MSNDIRENVSGKIYYFDPNNVKYEKIDETIYSSFTGLELEKNPEDYSIAVDLEVINKNRHKVTVDDKTYNFIDNTQKISFFKGKKIGDTNVLTSFFTDINHEEDTNDDEALNISSIDIDFSSWYTPVISINFIDVRGDAMFSKAQVLETKTSEEVQSNFFSSFFTLPFPIFKLKIKGFYGNSVTYPLHLSDFKSTFNSSTGNFDITCQFIGYNFAILSDLQMPYLVAAPYTEKGKGYWDDNVKSGRFLTLEGLPLLRIPELKQKSNDATVYITKMDGSSDIVKENEESATIVGELGIINDLIDKYVNYLKGEGYIPKDTTSNKYKILKINKNNTEIGKQVDNLKQKINSFQNTYDGKTSINNITLISNDIKIDDYFSIPTQGDTTTKSELDLSSIKNIISTEKKRLSDKKIELANKIDSMNSNSLEQILGIKPSIYNYVKLLLAHTETLLYIIKNCADNINANLDSRVNLINQDDIDLKLDNKRLPPFPWYTVNGQDEWIGKNHGDLDEVKFVKNLIEAETESMKLLESEINNPTGSDIPGGGDGFDGIPWIPFNAFDVYFYDGHYGPYEKYIEKNNFNNIGEMRYLLSLRISMLIGLTLSNSNDDSVTKQIENYAKLESLNILNSNIGKTTKELENIRTVLNSIKSGTDNITDSVHKYKYMESGSDYYSFTPFGSLINDFIPYSYNTYSEISSTISPQMGVVTDSYSYYQKPAVSTPNPPTLCKIVEYNDNIKKWKTGVDNISTEVNDYTLNTTKELILFDKTNKDFFTNLENDSTIINKILPKRKKNDEILANYHTGNEGAVYDYFGNLTNSDYDFETEYESYNSDDTKYNGYPLGSRKDGEPKSKNIKVYPLKGNTTINLNKDRLKLLYGEYKFDEISNDDLDISKYTLPFLGGYIYLRTSVKLPFSIFGTSLYYAQNNIINKLDKNSIDIANRIKAFLFLQTLPIDITESTIDLSKLDKSFMYKVNKVSLLLLGGMMWRYKNNIDIQIPDDSNIMKPYKTQLFKINDALGEVTNNKSKSFTILVNGCGLYYDNKEKIINKLNNYPDLVNSLVTYFTDWVDGDWIVIENNLGLRYKGKLMKPTSEIFKSNSYNMTDIYNDLGGDIFIKNYFEISLFKRNTILSSDSKLYKDGVMYNYNELLLYNRDGSDGVNAILTLLKSNVVMLYSGSGRIRVNPNSVVILDKTTDDLTKDKILTFINTLDAEIADHIEKENSKTTSSTQSDEIDLTPYIESEDVNLEVYRYVKTLYDKWISGYSNDDIKWIDYPTKNGINADGKTKINGFNTYNINNFKFIDRSYNEIGDKLTINIDESIGKLFDDSSNGATLYQNLTTLLSDNQFVFIPMPNYQSWNSYSSFTDIFQPMSYFNSDISKKVRENTIFVCMYSGTPSKRLNMDEDTYEYKNDNLDLIGYGNQTPPSDFSSSFILDESNKDMRNVPVFAVAYAKQNQSYFKSLSLNQNNPTTTEGSVMVLKNLLNRNDKTSNVSTIGQGLYDLYSNYSYTCDVTMMGCPQIQPMMYFQLTNIPMWNGAYLIYKVKHSITPGNMETTFTGMRMGKSYPKMVLPIQIGTNSLGAIASGVEPKSTATTKIKGSDMMGTHFRVKDYFKEDQNGKAITDTTDATIPVWAYNRILYNEAPIIDEIYDKWKASEYGKKYGNFSITSGCRFKIVNGNKNSMHLEALAADIQLESISSYGSKEDKININTVFYDFIKSLMRQGLHVDELRNERPGDPDVSKNTKNPFVHVGSYKIENNNALVRGKCVKFNEYDEIIEQAKVDAKPLGSATATNSSDARNKFLEYWKYVENPTPSENGGYNSSTKTWTTFPDPNGKDTLVGYGIKVNKGGFKTSDFETYMNKTPIAIPTNVMLAEVNSRIDETYNYIKTWVGGDTIFSKIKEIYKYVAVDIYMQVGSLDSFVNFKEFLKTNDVNGIKEHCKTGFHNKKNEWVEDTRRNGYKIELIDGTFTSPKKLP